MSALMGEDITPNSGSSLRKILKLNLSPHMEALDAISTAATKEHAIQITMTRMKEEWIGMSFQLTRYR